jgi:hypothetical protein
MVQATPMFMHLQRGEQAKTKSPGQWPGLCLCITRNAGNLIG